MANKQQQPSINNRPHFKHRPVGNHRESLRRRRVDQVRIAAGDGAEFIGIGRGPKARRHSRVAKTQRAGSQKSQRALPWSHHHFQRAAFHFLGVSRISEMPRGQNDRPCSKHLSLPPMRKAEVNGRGACKRAHCATVYCKIQRSWARVLGTGQPRAASTMASALRAVQPRWISVHAAAIVERPMLPRQ